MPMMPNAIPSPMAAFTPFENLPRYVLEETRLVEDVGDAMVNGEAGAGLGGEDVDTALFTFQPTTAMALTLGFAVKVIAVYHDRLTVLAVDAYVKTMPGKTSDKQFPAA